MSREEANCLLARLWLVCDLARTLRLEAIRGSLYRLYQGVNVRTCALSYTGKLTVVSLSPVLLKTDRSGRRQC